MEKELKVSIFEGLKTIYYQLGSEAAHAGKISVNMLYQRLGEMGIKPSYGEYEDALIFMESKGEVTTLNFNFGYIIKSKHFDNIFRFPEGLLKAVEKSIAKISEAEKLVEGQPIEISKIFEAVKVKFPSFNLDLLKHVIEFLTILNQINTEEDSILKFVYPNHYDEGTPYFKDFIFEDAPGSGHIVFSITAKSKMVMDCNINERKTKLLDTQMFIESDHAPTNNELFEEKGASDLSLYGTKAATNAFIQGLMGNVMQAHERGLWEYKEHINYAMNEINRFLIHWQRGNMDVSSGGKIVSDKKPRGGNPNVN